MNLYKEGILCIVIVINKIFFFYILLYLLSIIKKQQKFFNYLIVSVLKLYFIISLDELLTKLIL